jgi:hypothetical protein
MKVVTDENKLSLEIFTNYELDKENLYIMSGGDNRNLSWDEYLDDYRDEYKKYILLLKNSIEENNLIGYTGEDINGWVFKFSDNNIWGFTWRGWGDLMQAIVNKREGYMTYYM